MGTLQSGKSPGQRIKAGSTVLARATTNDVRAVKKRLDALRSVQREYVAAHEAASKANAALIEQQRIVGGLDDGQDLGVERWAAARIGAGAKRLSPFAEIGGPTPSDLKERGDEAEANLILKLAAKDKKHADARVKKAATAADAAARAVLAAMKPIAALKRTRDAAVAARDAIGPRWEKAFASLKRGARAAEDEGSTGLLAALFDAPTRAPKKAAKPKAQPSATNGAGAVA